MATDGTKIIDGDRAHDTYWGIMDLFDSEASSKMIIDEYPIVQKEFFDEFDNEVYVTSCGLAYWEIGLMTSERLKYIKTIVSKNACADEWTKLSNKEGNSRSRVLKNFIKKISVKNSKVRKAKKYRKISNFIFNENDILTFKLSDNSYRALICLKIDQYRGNCNYWFVPITYQSTSKPNLELIAQQSFLGSKIGSGYARDDTRKMQPGIEIVWDYLGGKPNFIFGFVIDAVEHKDLLKFKHHFECLGRINIIEGLKKAGSYGYSQNFQRFEERYSDLEKEIKVFRYEKYPLKLVTEK